jgi:hypothetical protein
LSGRLDRLLVDAGRAEPVVLAKLMGALVPLIQILLTIGPAASFAWLVGGLPTSQAAASLAVVLATIALIAAVGLLCAALSSTEVTALLASSVAAAFFLLGPLFAGVGLSLAGLHAVGSSVASVDPFVALLTTQPDLTTKIGKLLSTDLPSPEITWTVLRFSLPAYLVDVAVYLVLAAFLVWLTSIAIEPLHPIKAWRLRPPRLIVKPA